MEGTFFITLDYLKQLGACREGQREFQRVFPGGGEYQEVLDRCAKEGRLDFAKWLFSYIGKTDDVRVYEDKIDSPDENIFFAGNIKFKQTVKVKNIFSGCGITAGEGITAGKGIKAGEDFCIFAGLKIMRSKWELHAVVTAKTKPINLISGFWKPDVTNSADETRSDG